MTVMLAAQGLSKRYGDHLALDGFDLQVSQGEVVGLLGPNGAGKTTALRLLSGFLPASAGIATLAGFNVAEEPLQVKQRLGYLPEFAPLYDDLTVREHLLFMGRIKGLRGSSLRQQVQRVMQQLGLEPMQHRLTRKLSKGFGQRTGLAQTLLGDPQVLILDEPTAGLDPRQIEEVRVLIRALAAQHTVILSTHILQEVIALCQRVVILSRGRKVMDARLDSLPPTKSISEDEATAVPLTRSLEELFLSLTEA
ncbi:MAG: ABC transporter ATP-binding protein [Myxococcota bacterium]